jgi:hypothetical protein
MDSPMLLKANITPQPLGGADAVGPAGSISLYKGTCPTGARSRCGEVRGRQ